MYTIDSMRHSSDCDHTEVHERHTRFSQRAFFVSTLLCVSRKAANRRTASEHVSLRKCDTRRRCNFTCKAAPANNVSICARPQGTDIRTHRGGILRRVRRVFIAGGPGRGEPLDLLDLHPTKVGKPDLPQALLPVTRPRHASKEALCAPRRVVARDDDGGERGKWERRVVLRGEHRRLAPTRMARWRKRR